MEYIPISAIQRLGYLVEHIFKNQSLSNTIFEFLKQQKNNLFRIPLKASAPTKGYASDERWKIIVNSEIEIDE